jgi:glycosyltransferase involved in cell wall biosynthesis
MARKVLYLSSTEWGNLGRRKVRLAHELARRDDVAAVLYVNPPVSTSILDVVRGRFAPSHLGDERGSQARALSGRSRREQPKLWVYDGSMKMLPLTRSEIVQRSRALHWINEKLYSARLRHACRQLPGDELVLWLNHPAHAFALDAFPARRFCCFDWTDDWSQYSLLPFDRAAIEKATERMLRQADVVFAVSQSLLERARTMNRNTHLAPNATDFALFSHASGESSETPLQQIPRPRLGYVGQIAETLDFGLVRSLAEAHPSWSFVFVGPVWQNCAAAVADLQRLPNVHFVAPQPHGSLPTLFAALDVCLLPHLRNALTQSMDPTKLYDYLASGRPIVSTPVAGTERFAENLYLAASATEFDDAIGLALQENGSRAAARREQAARNDWPQRAAEMWKRIGGSRGE